MRIVWELWASIRQELEPAKVQTEFAIRMLLLQQGLLKVSREMEDYPIHRAVFDRAIGDIVELSRTDKATLTSLQVFGNQVDCFGNTPLKLAVRTGDY